MQACTGQLLIYKAWFGVNKPGDRFDAELDDFSDVIIVKEPLNSEVKQERWETAALDTLGSMYVKLAQDSLECLWESLLNPKCMLWVYVRMRAWPEGRVLVARIRCQPLSILYSPHAHMKDRNNLFKNVPHPLSILWLKWMRHVFAEKGWCEILSRVLCVVEGSLSSWSLS